MAVIATTTVTITTYRDTQSVTRYYKLQLSGSETPTVSQSVKPSELAGLGWSMTEPEYVHEDGSEEDYSLYFFDASIFSNGEWTYSNVSLSTSYEAAKSAYNRAESVSKELIEVSAGISTTAKEVTLGIVAGYTTTEDLEEYKTTIENTFSGTIEGFEATFKDIKDQLSEVGDEVNTQKDYIRLVRGCPNCKNQVNIATDTVCPHCGTELTDTIPMIVIGNSGNPVTTVYTNDALEFRYNGQTVAKFTNEVLDVKNISSENQIAFFDQWAIRRGTYVDGVGYNLNDIWIGG